MGRKEDREAGLQSRAFMLALMAYLLIACLTGFRCQL